MPCSICKQEGHKANNKKFHHNFEIIKKDKLEKKQINDSLVLEEKLRSEIITNNLPKVLEICSIPSSIDINYLKEKVKIYMDGRKEFYTESGRNPYIEDEFSEFWLAKASKGKQIGKGSGGMDIQTNSNEGIDAMCVVMNKSNTSNEKSLMQNFKTAGENLDTLFKEKKDKEAIELFTNEYITKIKKTKENNKLTDLYILSFISTKTNVFIVCFKLYIDRISNVKSLGFTEQCKNIKTDNFIDSKLGDIRLYKSKKRLELRFKKNILNDTNIVNIYDIS